MLYYIVKRILILIPILLVTSVIIFSMSHIGNSDPALVMVGGHQTSSDVLHNIRVKYHLNEPVWKQYAYWVNDALHGNLGDSYKQKQPVSKLIIGRLPLTFQLIIMTLILTVIISVPLGIISAYFKNKWPDIVSSVFTFVCVSSPVFFTSTILILVFSYQLGWLPAFGQSTSWIGNIRYLLMPSVALACNMIALNTQVTRSGMVQALNTDYIQTAVSKGLPTGIVVLKHALKNALLPLLTITGLQIGILITGAVLVEYTFGLGGLGSLIVQGVQSSDYPIIQGTTLFLVTLFLLINLLVDVLYAVIDPRIRLK